MGRRTVPVLIAAILLVGLQSGAALGRSEQQIDAEIDQVLRTIDELDQEIDWLAANLADPAVVVVHAPGGFDAVSLGSLGAAWTTIEREQRAAAYVVSRLGSDGDETLVGFFLANRGRTSDPPDLMAQATRAAASPLDVVGAGFALGVRIIELQRQLSEQQARLRARWR